MSAEWIVIVLIGLGAGVMAGMFGIGGGVVMVPALVAIMGFSLIEANGTSLAALMMPVGILAVIAYYRKDLLDMKVAAVFAVGLLAGAYFGAKLALSLPAGTLKAFYGIFLLYVSWRFIEPMKLIRRWRHESSEAGKSHSDAEKQEKHLPFYYLLPFGILAGILSGLFGIGGGLVMVPMMVAFMNFNPKKAVGTSLGALLLPVALPGVIAYYNAGQLNILYAALLAGGLVFGSVIGARITISLPTLTVKRVYAVFLLVMALDFLFSGLLFSQTPAQAQEEKQMERYDFKKFYEEYNVTGCFLLYDMNRNAYTMYNAGDIDSMYTPASTFKIFNSLVGLETGVVPDENFVIKWDGRERSNPAWNKDQDMKAAFTNSTVWYYQEVADRVGEKRMKQWIKKAHYGNEDMKGNYNRFWLVGRLRISVRQQVDFLVRLFKDQLPFSKRSMEIVKKIMIQDSSKDYSISAKSGWGEQDGYDVGWYVGYVTTGNNTYFFANCVRSPRGTNKNFAKSRIDITQKIFDEMKLRK